MISEEEYLEAKAKVEAYEKAKQWKLDNASGPQEEFYIKNPPKEESYSGCSCQGWGCMKCCKSEEEIRARQGTFG